MARLKSKNDLKSIREFKRTKRNSIYPPILDRDPEFAAEFLTIEDSEVYLKVMQDVLSIVVRGNLAKLDETPLIYTITFSRANFNWFCKFTYKLEELVLGEVISSFEQLEFPDKDNKLRVYPPFHSGGKTMIPDTFRVKTTDEIDLHRISYIKKDLVLEDFREGFPAWYLMSTSTVFEQYNEVTNTRVRIDFRNGEFVYFISGASDNWKQISGVPLEMDHVVSALLFRS